MMGQQFERVVYVNSISTYFDYSSIRILKLFVFAAIGERVATCMAVHL